ncbi:Uncharacterised nucleotidyltransferase [Noviherbaspirillum humi]|uniref:Uncharacterized nucleotidyltransferase n=1 Tax=Noviherbaspirillum humi TaxID=1688639 RepID=A0A239HIP6_9BURK|nr:nucleotidyltransferase family protein [Noviherbaspirillum humi]SNS81227.1 Uncharacterised nucleotidyltransferase [Noviherbaspirillum humi]
MRQPLLLALWREPQVGLEFSLAEWDLAIRQARSANVLASLDRRLAAHGLLDLVPARVKEHLLWIRGVAHQHRQTIYREAAQICRALADLGDSVIFLKGAAYTLAELPVSQGRLFSDIDVLVPEESLPAVESALLRHGWAFSHLHPYDQHYYRMWMHELPPMRHVRRGTHLDVHHAIVPKTARIRPDASKLCQAAQPVAGHERAKVLAPEDMVLHSAVHLFYEGEIDQGLRGLMDLDAMLIHFGDRPNFWERLLARAMEMDLMRPLFYGIRYAQRILGTPIPAHIVISVESGAPPAVLQPLMDAIFHRVFLPNHASCCDRKTRLAAQALYLRGNWLRMPMPLLARHLSRKAWMSWKEQFIPSTKPAV